MRKLNLLILASLLLYGCEKSEDMDTSPGENTKSDASGINFKALFSKDHTMKQAEAEALALDAARMFYGNGLKAGRGKTIEKTTVVRNSAPVLKSTANSAHPDTLAYVLNFADSAGFAVICADDRVDCPVLACTGSGVLDSAAIEENPGLAIFMENAEDYIVQKVREFEQRKDSLMAEAQKYLIEDNETVTLKSRYATSFDVTSTTMQGPFIQVEWGQENAPYNLYTPIENGKHTPAGCPAVAVGQIMSYWEYPNYPWKEMKTIKKASFYEEDSEAYLSIATLLCSLGVAMKSTYHANSSGAPIENIINTIKNWGYNAKKEGYSWNSVKNSLDLKRPVLMAGYVSETGRGHIWIIDGYIIMKGIMEYYLKSQRGGRKKQYSFTKDAVYNLVHYNWGYEGRYNGYFNEGVFQPNKPFLYDEIYDKMDKDDNFKYDKNIILIWR